MDDAAPWSVKGKVCVVTGASGGIGKQVALGLAREGARVVIVSHSPERAKAAVDEIARISLNPHVDLVVADLSTHAGVQTAAAEIDRRYRELRVLVNNAGLLVGKRTLTEDGLELTFALNHLAYFHLTNLLIQKIKASAPARIICTASNAHRLGRLDWDNLQGERRYSQWAAYGTSKLMNILFAAELARRLEGTGVTANAVHPGFVRSDFARTASPAMRAVVRAGMAGAISVEKGARTTLWAATAPELSAVTGKYMKKSRVATPSAAAGDEAAQRRLWDLSARVAGLPSD